MEKSTLPGATDLPLDNADAASLMGCVVRWVARNRKRNREEELPDQSKHLCEKRQDCYIKNELARLSSEVRSLAEEIRILRAGTQEVGAQAVGRSRSFRSGPVNPDGTERKQLASVSDIRLVYPRDTDVWQFVKLLLNAEDEGLQTADLVCCKRFGGWPARIKMNIQNPGISDEVILSYPGWRSPDGYESLSEMRYLLVEFFEARPGQDCAWVKHDEIEPLEIVLRAARIEPQSQASVIAKRTKQRRNPALSLSRAKGMRAAMQAAKNYHASRVEGKRQPSTVLLEASQHTNSQAEFGISQVTIAE
jgi:hypothetical protein